LMVLSCLFFISWYLKTHGNKEVELNWGGTSTIKPNSTMRVWIIVLS
jgi:hypothetical protein